ncbi:o-succinylbenzoate synthase [Alicyclobacillus cellulosilyticus]|uniref:o-succinylbenzoate synthase n=1 Tax=Alicyclobacillus cellulosilyticus TaxID=1003997 RepID=A0A917KCD3_9BACL|nr:o-succinylbenzoate synthase [Alicyclobacillus cellulosilyticus]GGJ05892.1 o-succinylbenzoate synthase [Alicyclobacillus cellulosilyticus]
MRIVAAVFRRVVVPFQDVFATSYGRQAQKDVAIVELITDEGVSGFGECAAGPAPLYTEETIATAWHMWAEHMLPRLMREAWHSAADLARVHEVLAPLRGNPMAKAALETAVWDAFAALTGRPLVQLLGGVRTETRSGISIGLQPDIPTLLGKVEQALQQGYARVKVKIQPGWDVEPLAAIRRAFGDISLAADANGAYRLADLEHLRRLDDLGLAMLEQPFAPGDLIHHARLQQAVRTPVCLDESIRDAHDVEQAAAVGACRVVNVKIGRVGGFAEARRVHDACREHGIEVWCGGMMETGIGRLHALALASLPGFTMPGDIGPSDRYFAQDVIDPPVAFARPGVLPIEPVTGVAARVRRDRLEAWTVERAAFP